MTSHLRSQEPNYLHGHDYIYNYTTRSCPDSHGSGDGHTDS